MLKKLPYFLLGLLLGIPFLALAVNITVPSAPSSGYALVSTSTGAYIATTTDPFHVGSIFSTSTATSTFNGGINLSNQGCFAVAGVCITSGTGGSAYPFPLAGNATSTLTQFNGGLTAYASSTIGNGTQAGGLTVNGGLVFNGNGNLGANTLYGNSFGSGDSLTMNGASGYTLLNGNNGWGINMQADYTRLVPGGASRVDLQFNTSQGISLLPSGVLSFDSSSYQDGLGSFLVASSTNTSAFSITPLGTPAGAFLAVDPHGRVIATTTPSFSGVTSVTGTYPVISSGGTTPAISLAFGTTTTNIWSNLQTFTSGFLSNASSTITSGLFSANGGASTTVLTTTGATYLATLGGNVGIGTTNPSFNLDVTGTGHFTTSIGSPLLDMSSAGANKAVFLMNSGGTNFGKISVQAGSPGAWSLGYGSGDNNVTGTPVLTWNENNNVGVGTSSPYAQFSLGGGNLVIGAATAGGSIGDLFLPKLGTTAGSFLAVNPSGQVIATTTPTGSNSAFSPAANYATTGALPSNTYVNGSSGVGATITEVGTGALSVDGANPSVGQLVLVKNEGTASHNGLYDVTVAGSGIAAFVLTRDPAYNSSNNIIPGIITYVISGTINNDDFYAMTAVSPITVGTTNLTYVEVSGGGAGVASVTGNANNTLTISPTTGAVIAGINLTNPNIWTGLQQFSGFASTTQLSVFNNAYFGATATSTFNNMGYLGIASTTPIFPLSVNTIGSDFYVKTTGEVVGTDATNAWEGVITPTHRLSLQTGTTTTWTASTTGTAYSPFIVAPFTGTVKQIYCLTDLTGLGVNIQVNGSNASPSYFVASTTAGNVKFTAGNTFTKGQKILMNVGTTTTSTATTISCTLDITETP